MNEPTPKHLSSNQLLLGENENVMFYVLWTVVGWLPRTEKGAFRMRHPMWEAEGRLR